MARIRECFVATELFSSYAARRGSQFDLDRDLEAARTGKAWQRRPAGRVGPLRITAGVPRPPDQDDPKPTHVERPWNRPY